MEHMANVSVVCVGRSVIKLWGFFMFICFRFFISYLISARQFFRNFLFYVNTWGKVKKEPSAVINHRKLFCLYFFFYFVTDDQRIWKTDVSSSWCLYTQKTRLESKQAQGMREPLWLMLFNNIWIRLSLFNYCLLK